MRVLLLLFACDDTEFPPPHGGTAVSGDTWADVARIVEGECLACHSAASALGNLDLETDGCTTLLTQPSFYGGPIVTPGDSQASVLWHKMAATGEYGGVMPPGGTAQENIDTVAAWIDAGASCGDTGGTP